MQESRAIAEKLYAELAKRVLVPCVGVGGGFSEHRNASEGRTDMDVVIDGVGLAG